MLGIPALQFLSPEVGGECECVSVCVNLHFSRDIHLGHGYEVAMADVLSLCLASPPGAQIFILVFQGASQG